MQVKTKHYLMLLLLAAIWGSSFPFLKIALESYSPILTVAMRLTLSAIAMSIFIYAFRLKIPTELKVWKHYSVVAIVGNIVPFVLITWGEQYIDAALASVLMGLIPLATLISAHYLTDDEKMSLNKLMGVVLGCGGVVVLIGVDALQGFGAHIWAQLAVIIAACCYGVSAVYARRSKITQYNPLANSAGILICSAILSMPIALMVEDLSSFTFNARSMSALLILALACTCFAYFLLYNLLAQVGATFTSFNNYLVPVFGMIISVILLGDTIDSSTYTALTLIFIGLVLSQKKPKLLNLTSR
ncbi:DMT family transporter [Vibrio ziniensis]|uniref:DMT family transporter n=1 Tax=Vibrio ziniensis TaxID=2711221 RepID=A0A6G7CHH2_9VIBR|nr:DMT family transporter [Vibrio ziniensis]QIH41601.1 DMT family transporter [Vibrio ziniensis]